MDEFQAIQRLKKGDIGGLEFLVFRYQVKAVRTAYLISRDLGLAEDVVQDAFIRAYRSIGGFDQTRSFGPWFLRSVVNAAVKLMQRTAKRAEMSEEADALFAELAQRIDSVEARVEESEIQGQIWDAMQKLSPRQRAVIVQRYLLDMNEKEMAARTGVAPGTVKWTLSAARERLRRLLTEKE